MRLRELVDELVDAAYKIAAPNPRVLVRWSHDDGRIETREIEMTWPERDGGAVVLHVPREPQLAGEPGAGDVCDESVVPELDVELVLGYATGARGCACPDGRCAAPTMPECRERLKAEQLERIRKGERCRVTRDPS